MLLLVAAIGSSCSPNLSAPVQTAVAQVGTMQALFQTAEAARSQAVGAGNEAATQLAQAQGTAEAYQHQVETSVAGAWGQTGEMPVEVGLLEAGSAPADDERVRLLFRDAYRNGGGESQLGKPEHRVQRMSRAYYQMYAGGVAEHAMLILADYTDQAYTVTGAWYRTYMGAGGPESAGYPTSNPEAYGPGWPLPRGQRQTFDLDGDLYALMRQVGSADVHLIPPDIWAIYDKDDLVNQLGYPVASFPLAVDEWKSVELDSPDIENALRRWSRSPYRILTFEKGSLWFDSTLTQHETVTHSAVNTLNFLTGMSRAFSAAYDGAVTSGADNCTLETLRHGTIAPSNEYLKRGFMTAAFLPLDSTATVVLSGSGMANLVLRMGYALVKTLGSESVAEELASFVAGEGLDVLYQGLLGEYLAEELHLSAPLTGATLEMGKEWFNSIKTDRLSETIVVYPGNDWLLGGPSTMSAQGQFTYDPLTRVAIGLIASDCNSDGILIQYRLDPQTGYPLETATSVYSGATSLWDLSTQESIP